MRGRTAVTAATLATAAVLLTACGGGGSGDSDKISSPPSTTAAPSSSATATSTATGAPTKIDPSLALPADLRLNFDWAAPTDHAQAIALATAANFIQSMDHAVVKQSTKDAGLATYSSGKARSFATTFVQDYITHRWTLTGTDHFYRPKVTLGANKTYGEVTFCDNQSKVYGKEIKTGKVLTTPEDDSSYVSYSVVVAKLQLPTEVWQAQSITVKEKALQCK